MTIERYSLSAADLIAAVKLRQNRERGQRNAKLKRDAEKAERQTRIRRELDRVKLHGVNPRHFAREIARILDLEERTVRRDIAELSKMLTSL